MHLYSLCQTSKGPGGGGGAPPMVVGRSNTSLIAPIKKGFAESSSVVQQGRGGGGGGDGSHSRKQNVLAVPGGTGEGGGGHGRNLRWATLRRPDTEFFEFQLSAANWQLFWIAAGYLRSLLFAPTAHARCPHSTTTASGSVGHLNNLQYSNLSRRFNQP